MVRRGEVWLTVLDPTVGSEIRKTRPCLIVSPDELNKSLRTHIVVPLTSGGRPAPFRPEVTFRGTAGRLLPDQMRSVDRARLIKRLGDIDSSSLAQALSILRRMFED